VFSFFQIQIPKKLNKTDQFSKFIKRRMPTIHKYFLVRKTAKYYLIANNTVLLKLVMCQ